VPAWGCADRQCASVGSINTENLFLSLKNDNHLKDDNKILKLKVNPIIKLNVKQRHMPNIVIVTDITKN
jgi:hypothetical protein